MTLDQLIPRFALDRDLSEMRFVLNRTRQEAKRNRVAVAGIADYQTTISEALPTRYPPGKASKRRRSLPSRPTPELS
jgi:hypothetical protein